MDALDFSKLEIEDTEKEVIDLNVLKKKAEEMLALEGDISRLEDQLKAKQAELRKVSEVDIPELLERAGMTAIPLKDGMTIEVATDLYTSIPQARKNEILAAVRARGGGDLIKNELTIVLDKGKDNAAAQIEETAKEMGLEVERSEGIAAPTYKKWIKEEQKSDKPIDLAFFGAHQVTRAKVVQTKKGKKS